MMPAPEQLEARFPLVSKRDPTDPLIDRLGMGFRREQRASDLRRVAAELLEQMHTYDLEVVGWVVKFAADLEALADA